MRRWLGRVNSLVQRATTSHKMARGAWVMILVTLIALMVAAGVLGLPLGLQLPASLQWVGRGLLVAGFLVGLVGPITGRSLIEVSHRLRQALERAGRGAQFSVIVVCCLALLVPMAAGATVVLTRHSPTQPSGGAESLVPGRIELEDSSRPGAMAVAANGSIWLTDFRRSTVTYVAPGSAPREYTLPGVKELADAPSSIGSGADGVAIDSGGNAWVLSRFPEPMFSGFRPTGEVIAQYQVPSTLTFVIDRNNHAWLANQARETGGIPLTDVDLATGKSTTRTVLPDLSGTTDVRLGPDGQGNVWLVAKDQDQNVHRAVIDARGSAQERVTQWPRALLWPSDGNLMFAVSPDGAMWIPHLGAIARIDAGGAITDYPLYRNSIVTDIAVTRDGRLAYTWLLGSITWFSSLTAPINEGFVSVFDPKQLTRFPTLRRVESVQPMLGIAPGGGLLVTGPDVSVIAILPLDRPPVPTSERLKATLLRDISGIRAEDTAHDQALTKATVIPGMRAIQGHHERSVQTLRADLKADPIAPPPALAQQIEKLAAGVQQDASQYRELEQVKDTSSVGGYFLKLRLLQERFRAELGELGELAGASPSTSTGTPQWGPAT